MICACGAEFTWVGSGMCPACTRQAKADEAQQRRQDDLLDEQQRRHDEADARQRERDEEQRDREEAQRYRDEEQQWAAEKERQSRKERDAERLEEQNEAFLERQREQYANRWRYEAESKLERARELYSAGAQEHALALANEAAPLGIEAFELIGSIYRALGNSLKYREQLRTQIGFLRSDIPNFVQHRERVLSQILELAGPRDSLVSMYFEAAQTWKSFPYKLRPLLQASGLLESSDYRQLVTSHIQILAEQIRQSPSSEIKRKLLTEILSLSNNESLIAEYMSALDGSRYFPFEIIDWLLAEGRTSLANELFTRKAGVVCLPMAHGTSSTFTPQAAHCTRRMLYSNSTAKPLMGMNSKRRSGSRS